MTHTDRSSLNLALLASLGLPVLVLDEQGIILDATPYVRGIIGRVAGMSIKNGQLRMRRASEQKLWRRTLASALATKQIFALRSRSENPFLIIELVPINSSSVVARLRTLSGAVDHVREREMLVSLFGLSPRETDVALCVVSGLRPQETAKTLGLALETVRGHQKSVMRKTGFSHAGQLAVALARLGG